MNFMEILNNVMSFLATTGDVGLGLRAVGAGIAVLTGFGSGIGEGNAAAHALDAMARQPEMAGNLRTTMLIGQAVAETTGLYGFIVALLALFAL